MDVACYFYMNFISDFPASEYNTQHSVELDWAEIITKQDRGLHEIILNGIKSCIMSDIKANHSNFKELISSKHYLNFKLVDSSINIVD